VVINKGLTFADFIHPVIFAIFGFVNPVITATYNDFLRKKRKFAQGGNGKISKKIKNF
jgi:hypothetical protein